MVNLYEYNLKTNFNKLACAGYCKLIILLNGFQKKSNKTPQKEIERAMRIKQEYFELKNKLK